MENPIIFLDYDGVLNSPYYCTHIPKNLKGYERDFDPKRVEILRTICQQNSAQVVVISSWRHDTRAWEYLQEKGIPIIDALSKKELPRGEHIQFWRDTFHRLDRYLILDDETSEYTEKDFQHLICTREVFSPDEMLKHDYGLGLQPKHIEWAKTILTKGGK